MREFLGRARVDAVSPVVDAEATSVFRRDDELGIKLSGRPPITVPLASIDAVVGNGTIELTAPSVTGTVFLDFRGGRRLLTDVTHNYAYEKGGGFPDVVATLEHGGAAVKRTTKTKVQAGGRRGAIMWVAGPCFAFIEMAMFAMSPALAGEVLAGATRFPYPYAAAMALLLVVLSVAGLMSMPGTAMVRAVVREAKTARAHTDAMAERGPTDAVKVAFLPHRSPKPVSDDTTYSVILGRPLWRLAAIAVVMTVIAIASYLEFTYGDQDASLVAMVGRALVMIIVVAGYVLPGAEPVEISLDRGRRQIVARRYWYVALFASFVGGLAIVASFPVPYVP